MMVGMLGQTALGLCDTKLVGALGAAALGGVGMGAMLLSLCYAMVTGLMRGVKVRAAYAVGEGRPGDAGRYAQAGATLGVAFGVVMWAASRDVTPVLHLIGLEASMVPYARDFVAARSWGAVAACAATALFQYLQGVGDARTPMRVGIVANVLNALLAWSLIYGHLGLPALGVRGAGYATSVTEVLELVALTVAVGRRARAAGPATIALRSALRRVTSVGLPTGLQFVFETLASTTFLAILGTLGATQLAAHQITMSSMRASFLPGVAVAEAASVLVAQSLGERRLAEADRVTRVALVWGVGFMTLCGVAFAVSGAAVAGAFTDDGAVVQVARRLFLVAAVFQALDAVALILGGALRGAKEARWVATVGVTLSWLCVPGAAFVLGKLLGWGALGAWLGYLVEGTLVSALLWWRWSRGVWRATFTGITIAAR